MKIKKNLPKRIDKNIKRNYIYNIVFVGFTLLLLTLVGWRFIDPDYGWRLKTGEYILKNGIPKTDIYTYTMPSFPWVDHAWPQDVVIYLSHVHLGKSLQSFIWAIMAIGALLVSLKIFSKFIQKDIVIFKNKQKTILASSSYVANVFLVLGFLTLLNYFGVRVQVTTWLLFAVFIYLLFNRELWKKYRKLIPAYFLVWVNLHGGFASGLAAFFTYSVFQTIRTRKVDKTNVLLFVLSVLVTLINPYGPSLWREVWSSVSDSQLRWRIMEWQPFIFRPYWSTSFFIGLSTVFILLFRKYFKLEELGLFFIFLFQALLSTRHIPLWVIIAVPMGSKALFQLYKESLKYQHGKERFVLFYKILWFIVALVFIGEIAYSSLAVASSREERRYPMQAISFLKKENYNERIFSDYGWGGYLVWKYPEKKVYIDGRMPSWRWDANIEGETNSASDDYFSLIKGESSLKKELEKYDIRIILWRNQGKKNLSTVMVDMLKNIFVIEDKNQYVFTEEIEEIGWQKIYEDETSVIYRK